MNDSSTPSSHLRFPLLGPNATVFVASACIMILEIVAGRVVSKFLGQSLYTWTSIIGVVLAGISVGNYVGGILADRAQPRRTLAIMFLISSASCLLIPMLNHVMGEWRLLWEASWPTRIFWHVTGTFLLPSLLLGTISPLVAKIALERSDRVGKTIGNVYAWGAAGSIFGTFLSGYLLISLLGSIAVVCVVSSILAVMALVYFPRRAMATTWVVLTFLALYFSVGVTGFARKVGTSMFLREALPEKTVWFEESQYTRVLIEDVTPYERVMYLDKLAHSSINTNDPSRLMAGYPWIFEAVTQAAYPEPDPLRALVIGGGGYVFPRHLEETRPGSYIEVAEIDPRVTQAAFDAFGLSASTNMRISNTDGRHRVQDLVDGKEGKEFEPFDMIYGDTINDAFPPYHLFTQEFNEDIATLLNQRGMYLVHVVDAFEHGHFLAAVIRTCRETFPSIDVIALNQSAEVRGSFMVVCSREPRDLKPALLDLQRRQGWKGAHLPVSTIEDLLERTRPVVLTDNHAPVEHLLMAAVKKETVDVIALHVKNAYSYLEKGKKSQDEPEAKSWKQRAVAEVEQARKYCPDCAQMHYEVGVMYLRYGDPDKAFEGLSLAIEHDPKHVDAMNFRAMILARSGALDQAVAEWGNALAIQPYSLSAHSDLANAYTLMKKYDLAEAHLRKALEIDPGSAYALLGLGNLRHKQKDAAGALKFYERALIADPRSMEAAANLALERIEQGQIEEAKEALKIAESIDPKNQFLQGIRQKISEKEQPASASSHN